MLLWYDVPSIPSVWYPNIWNHVKLFSSPDLQKKHAKKTASFLDDNSEISDVYQSGNYKKKSKHSYNNVDGDESDDSSFKLNQNEEYV